MTKNFTFKAEEIFEDIEGDDDNVLMNIPPEILEATGWKPGDTLQIESEKDIITLTRKNDV